MGDENNNNNPAQQNRDRYYQIVKWARSGGCRSPCIGLAMSVRR